MSGTKSSSPSMSPMTPNGFAARVVAACILSGEWEAAELVLDSMEKDSLIDRTAIQEILAIEGKLIVPLDTEEWSVISRREGAYHVQTSNEHYVTSSFLGALLYIANKFGVDEDALTAESKK